MERINLDFEAIEDMLAAFSPGKGVKQVANHYSPIYSFKTISVLVPEGFEWEKIIHNVYDINNLTVYPSFPCTFVIHGHDEKGFCRNDHYCHVYGYSPVGKERPSFLQGFYLKWPYLAPKPQQLEFGL